MTAPPSIASRSRASRPLRAEASATLTASAWLSASATTSLDRATASRASSVAFAFAMALRNVAIVVTECQVSIVGAQCQAQWPQGRERILETSVMWRFPTVFASGVLVLALFGGAIAGPLEDADRAYDRGDYDTAFSLWQSLADQGDASAQLHLGLMFDGGVGVKPDWGKAAEWYRKAAEQGNVLAQLNLGLTLDGGGADVPFDHEQADYWYRKAAEQGNVLAQRDLAMAYDAGEGVPQDHTQAATWYRRAAEQRDADAQAALGEMYADGRGVLQDYVQAHMWFNLAASAGYHDEAAKARDTLTAKMTPAQIAEAQKMAREWKPK
jgi:hypothetical protein